MSTSIARNDCTRWSSNSGSHRSLRLAQWLHFVMLLALIAFGIVAKLGIIYHAAMPLVAAALFYEHRSARQLDLAGINRAFFQSNALSARFSSPPWPPIAGVEITVPTARCVAHAGRLRNPSSTKPAPERVPSRFRDHAFSNREDVGIVMLAREPRGLFIPTQRATHASAPCSPPSLHRFPSRRRLFPRSHSPWATASAAGRIKSG